MKTRKNLTKKALAGAAIVTLATVPAHLKDANAAATSLNINAEIVAAIALSSQTALNFGTMTAGTGGDVIVAPGGALNVAGFNGVHMGGEADGVMEIVGVTGKNIDISVNTATVMLTNGLGDSMAVDSFVLQLNGETDGNASLAAPTSNILVGATLTVANGQAAGTYTGSVTINANY